MKHSKYRADIDGLCALAVLAVIGFHAFPFWMKGGFTGVDIFFVISGFLISTIIFENVERNCFSFIEFYSRRIKRIFPALLIVMIACFAIGWVALFADEYKQLGKHIAGGAGFVSNFLFWKEVGYFDTKAAAKPLLHLWSLGIEEQFYIIWPLCLWFSWKVRLNALTITITVVVISFILNINKIGDDAMAGFYLPQTRFWELLTGTILAYIKLYPEKTFPKFQKQLAALLSTIFSEKTRGKFCGSVFRNISTFIGITLIVIGLFVIGRDNFFPGWWALLPVTGTVFIISAGPTALLNRKFLSNRLLVWIGLISFPLYLWHWPLLSFARIVQGQPSSRGMRIAIIILSFVLAWLTYRLIERPIRFGHHNREKTVILAITMCFVGFIGYGSYLQEGFPFREVVKNNPSKDTGWGGGAEGHLVNECGITDVEDKKLFATCEKAGRQTPKYALLGDSKAAALYRGVMRTSTEGNRWLVIGGHGSNGSPVPVLSDSRIYNSYQKLTNIAIDAIINNTNIETVAFMTATRVLFQLKNDHSIEDLPTNKNYDVALDGLKNSTGKLINAGKKIVLIVDNPTLPDPKDCLNRKTSSDLLNNILLKSPNEHCRLQLSRHLELSQQYRKLLFEVQAGNPEKIKIFDTTQYLCDMTQGVCLSHKNGRRLYRYTDHVSDYAAGLIGEGLNAFLQRR